MLDLNRKLNESKIIQERVNPKSIGDAAEKILHIIGSIERSSGYKNEPDNQSWLGSYLYDLRDLSKYIMSKNKKSGGN